MATTSCNNPLQRHSALRILCSCDMILSAILPIPETRALRFLPGDLLFLRRLDSKPFPDIFQSSSLKTSEENGARGGQAYANDHIAELDKHSIALESDLGTFTPHGLSFAGSDEARTIVTAIGEQLLSGIGSGNVSGVVVEEDASYLNERGVPSGSLYTVDVRQGDASNNPCFPFSHTPYPEFHEENFGTSGYFWYDHTAADTIDKLSPQQQLQHCAATLAVFVYSIANLPFLLPL